jgi:hypothetical protein
MEEYYHRMYILGKVPQCVSFDMRQAIREGRVPAETARSWAPYLTSNSRYIHRKEIRRLHACGDFDYYKSRKNWINDYQLNLQRLKDTEKGAREGSFPLEKS